MNVLASKLECAPFAADLGGQWCAVRVSFALYLAYFQAPLTHLWVVELRLNEDTPFPA